MKSSIMATGIVVLGLGLCAFASDAWAAGIMLQTVDLAPPARASLLSDIQQARAKHPSSFSDVSHARAVAEEAAKNYRGRYPSIAGYLKNLGPAALMPMLEVLAVKAPPQGAMTDAAWRALRVGLLEAVGSLRDPRAEPVLRAIVVQKPADEHELRAAAEALGRLGTDSAAATLIALARNAGPHQHAVVNGMGDCRRHKVAQALSAMLDQHPSQELAQGVVRSLGSVGNAWAWKTPVVASSGEEQATRMLAGKAALKAFVTFEGAVRAEAQKALLVIAHPDAAAWIAAERKQAQGELGNALDSLAGKLQSNPLLR